MLDRNASSQKERKNKQQQLKVPNMKYTMYKLW